MARRTAATLGAMMALTQSACQGGYFLGDGADVPSTSGAGAGNAFLAPHTPPANSNVETGTVPDANLPSTANTTLGGNPNRSSPTNPNSVGGSSTGGPSMCPATPLAGSACDGFEGLTAGAAPNAKLWTVTTQNPTSTVVVDTTRAARGKAALHLHTANGGYERAAIVNTGIFPAGNNTFWGRAFFYIASPLPQTHFTLVAAADLPASPSQQPTWLRYGGQFGHFIANYYGNDAAQHAAVNVNGQWTMATVVPADRWVCLEWEFKGDTNELHLYEDGSIIERLSIVGTASDDPKTTWTAPTYGQVMVGWEIYGNSGSDASIPGYDIWIDEVALGPTRITCQL